MTGRSPSSPSIFWAPLSRISRAVMVLPRASLGSETRNNPSQKIRQLPCVLRLLNGRPLRPCRADHPDGCPRDARHQCQRDYGCRRYANPVPAHEFPDAIRCAGRAGHDRFMLQMPCDVGCQIGRRLVAPCPVLFQSLQRDPVQIAVQLPGPGCRVHAPFLGALVPSLPPGC